MVAQRILRIGARACSSPDIAADCGDHRPRESMGPPGFCSFTLGLLVAPSRYLSFLVSPHTWLSELEVTPRQRMTLFRQFVSLPISPRQSTSGRPRWASLPAP